MATKKKVKPDVTGLEAALNAWLDDNDKLLRGDARVLTQQEWRDRGEKYGRDADLTMIIDGSPLFACLNYGEPSWKILEDLIALAARFGYWHEQGYAWTVHFYPED